MKPAEPAPRWPIDWTDDRGQVGGIEVLPFAILIFVIGTLLIANAWAVVDAKLAVNAATRESVRAFVEASSEVAGRERSERIARETLAGYGRNPAKLELAGPDYQHGGGFERCNPVTIRASYPVPALTIPIIGGFGEAFRVSSSHTEIVDPFRSGLAAGGGCR